MPTTCPCMFTSGPPEFPWLIAASVWITLLYVRVWSAPHVSGSQFGSCAVIVRSSDETMPAVTVGPPSRASAYPSATTRWPSTRSAESPSCHGGHVLRVDLEDGQVVQAVRADHASVELLGIGVGCEDRDLRGGLHDVAVRHDDAVGPDDEAGAHALAGPVLLGDVGRHVDDAGRTRSTTASTGSPVAGSGVAFRVSSGLTPKATASRSRR